MFSHVKYLEKISQTQLDLSVLLSSHDIHLICGLTQPAPAQLGIAAGEASPCIITGVHPDFRPALPK